MDAQSFLSASDIAGIRDSMRDLWATTAAMQGGATSLRLARWNTATQKYDALPAQNVTITFADRAEREAEDESSGAVYVDGYFKALDPFDARPGDLFTLGPAGQRMRGEVVTIPEVNLGVAKVGWRLRLGAQ